MKFSSGEILKRYAGAVATRVIDRAGADIPVHAHDWPVLSLYRLGSYANESEAGTRLLRSPSAVFYAAGSMHANKAGVDGFEQIEIEFDPDWLGHRLPDVPVMHGSSGELVQLGRRLIDACERTSGELELKTLTTALIGRFEQRPVERRPEWLASIERQLRRDPARSISSLATSVGLSSSWVGAEFARWTGETVREASVRLRVGKAAVLLREGTEAPAAIAAGTGFFDQSHMTKAFRRILGRTPIQVRSEGPLLRT